MGYNQVPMRAKNLLAAALITGFFAVSAHAKAPVDDFSRLKAAKDTLALQRVALSMGAPKLSRALASPDADVVTAAVAIAPEVAFRTLLIPALLTVAEKRATSLALPALASLGRIARALYTTRGEDEQLEDDELDSFAVSVMSLAQRSDRPAEVRASALDVAAELMRDRGATPHAAFVTLILAALDDADPLVKRVAIQHAPEDAGDAVRQRIIAALDHADDAVVLAAAAAVCASAPAPALGETTAARLRTLALAPASEPSEIIGIIPCLRAHASPDDLAALKKLKKHKSADVRKRAKK